MGRHHNMQLMFFVALIFCCEVALSQLLDLFNIKVNANRNSTVKCKSFLECADCKTGRICDKLNGELIQFFLLNCDGDTPYCNNGICSKTPSAECSPISLCPFDGILPDPTDCTRYVRCAKNRPEVNQCPQNNVYNHAMGACVFGYNCVNFNCRGSQGKLVVYPQDNRLYAICTDDGPVIVGKCKDYEKFDQNQQKCVRYCTQTGTQPPDDPNNSCGKYYQCARISYTYYKPVEMSCACNEGYDEMIKGCSINATCLNGTDRCDVNFMKSLDIDNFIINNSGDNNNDNEVWNGNDDVDGNLVNGNDNGDNSDSGNVANGGPGASPLIINNSGNDNSNNSVSNGNDDVDGNIVNGNKNGNNSESGNVVNNRPAPVPLIINNSGNKNNNNKVSNGNDSVDGNLVNGNDNGDNSKSGNVQRRSVSPLIINNSGNDNSNNDVSNGNDDVDGNMVNGNKNGDNKNSGNVKNDPLAPPPVDNSESKDNQRNDNNDDENEKDGSGNVNDNNNPDDNNNSDDNNNPDKSQPIEDPCGSKINNFFRIFIDWIIRISLERQV